jgi:hypothetical protein
MSISVGHESTNHKASECAKHDTKPMQGSGVFGRKGPTCFTGEKQENQSGLHVYTGIKYCSTPIHLDMEIREGS